MILLGIILFLTVFEAVHEGLHLNGKRSGSSKLGMWSGIVEMVKLAGLSAIILLLLWTKAYDNYFQYSLTWKFGPVDQFREGPACGVGQFRHPG